MLYSQVALERQRVPASRSTDPASCPSLSSFRVSSPGHNIKKMSTLTASPLILCIDDEALGLHVRKAVLEREGYRVLTALDGSSGLNLFTDHPVEGVILDYFMPGMDGGQVAVEMRRRRPQVPILLLSAYINLPAEVVQTVDCTVLKGEGPVELLTKVRRMLSARSGAPGGTEALGESA
jgi:CheY-like chemotaxis protein